MIITDPSKGSFTVEMTRTVKTLVTCENCTEEQARTDPWEHAINEQDIDQIDWQVINIKRHE